MNGMTRLWDHTKELIVYYGNQVEPIENAILIVFIIIIIIIVYITLHFSIH